MEFHRGYLPKGRSNWVAITDVDKIMAGKMSGMETVDPESLVKPPHKELVQERIGELHEAALGSLIGRHQAREIVERYRRAPWGS